MNIPGEKIFDSLRCDSYESGLGRTTAVGLYPQGISPVGALDMSGNVWEWCSNGYDKPESINVSGDDRRVVRGGSWDNYQDFARTAYRSRRPPKQPFQRVSGFPGGVFVPHDLNHGH